MKFQIKNLGPLQCADLELGDLTVVCGNNNCGKTYLAYTLDTFLDTIEYNLKLPLRETDFNTLFAKGSVTIDLCDYVDDFIKLANKTVPDFTDTLPRFLAMASERFAQTHIEVPLDAKTILEHIQCHSPKTDIPDETVLSARITNFATLKIKKSSFSPRTTITLTNTSEDLPSKKIVKDIAASLLARIFNSSCANPLFPKSFIITSERTGAALFRSELMSVKVRTQEDVQSSGKIPTGYRGYGYQRPVEKDIEFVLDLERHLQKKSYIAEYHPEIIEFFSKIAGGTYQFDEAIKQVKFTPQGSALPLTLAESSSTVRALTELNFYLRHKAKRGQVLMFDEPEINLHPANQRLLARLLAKLVKAGIKVFITTHSDYIIREFNALVRLNALPEESRSSLALKHGFSQTDTLSPESVHIYILKDGRTQKVPYDEDAYAFSVSSFDDTIEKFNQLYNDLVDFCL